VRREQVLYHRARNTNSESTAANQNYGNRGLAFIAKRRKEGGDDPVNRDGSDESIHLRPVHDSIAAVQPKKHRYCTCLSRKQLEEETHEDVLPGNNAVNETGVQKEPPQRLCRILSCRGETKVGEEF
jgi:hypothetical protein